MTPYLVGHLAVIDVEVCTLRRHHGVGDAGGVVLYVGGADVVEPADLVHHRDDEGVGILLLHHCSNFLHLLVRCLAGVLIGLDEEVIERNIRHLLSADLSDKVVRQVELDPTEAQLLLQLCGIGDAHALAIECHPLYLRQAAKPCGDRRGAGHPLLHQLVGGPLEHLRRLEEVPRVGPEGGMLGGHHGSAGRAQEATDVLPRLPAVGGVLIEVPVEARHDDGIDICGSECSPHGV